MKNLKKCNIDYQFEDRKGKLQCQWYHAQLMKIYLATYDLSIQERTE